MGLMASGTWSCSIRPAELPRLSSRTRSSSPSTTWTQDTTVPTVLSATISDINVTGPGQHRITIQFSENMTNATTLQLIRKGTTAKTFYNPPFPPASVGAASSGNSIWTGYYNFTSADRPDGDWNIPIVKSASVIADLSGNALTNESTD